MNNCMLIILFMASPWIPQACAQPAAEGMKEEVTQSDPYLIGRCEGCEAVLEYNQPPDSHILTLPDYRQDGPRLHISGVVYQAGGQVPAADVIMYVYHTNQEGVYPTRGDETGWGRRHGYIRGWLRTDENGRYEIRTLRPGGYPDGRNPEHIHVTVLEPDGKYYWIDDFLFADDPRLPEARRQRADPRGGEGFLLKPVKDNGYQKAERSIELGKNVPGYPE